MIAYIIAWVEVHNTAWRDAYGPTTMAVIQKHGGKVLTGFGTTMETLEGDKPLPSAIVVIEFPSLEHAKAFYHDPEYAPMITLRQTGATTDIVVVEGV